MNPEIEKWVNLIDSNQWEVPYIGRQVNENFEQEFSYWGEYVKTRKFKKYKKLNWNGQVSWVQHNAYDESEFEHVLEVDLFEDGPEVGRIKSIVAHHTEYWHTSSNWQDHGEGHTGEVRGPNEEEIKEYCQILDRCTVKESMDIIETMITEIGRLCLAGKVVGSRSTSDWRFEHNYDISCHVEQEGVLQLISSLYRQKVKIDELDVALEWTRTYIEAIISDEFRAENHITKDPTIQYFLNLINYRDMPELYQRMERSKEAFLWRLYKQTEMYRMLVDADLGRWEREVRWRIDDLFNETRIALRNLEILQNIDSLNRYNSSMPISFDPLKRLIGKISISDMGEIRHMPKVGNYCFENVNGVRWAYFVEDQSNEEYVTIDLAQTRTIEPITDITIPPRLGGKVVRNILRLTDGPKMGWKTVRIEVEPCARKEVTAFTSLMSIGEGAFENESALECVITQAQILTIGDSAFADCHNLRSIQTVNGCDVTLDIGKAAFKNCYILDCVKIAIRHTSYNMVIVPDEAFAGCTSLKKVCFEKEFDSLGSLYPKWIGEKAFYNCKILAALKIPVNVEGIDHYAFYGCDSLIGIIMVGGKEFRYTGLCSIPRHVKTLRYKQLEDFLDIQSEDISADMF